MEDKIKEILNTSWLPMDHGYQNFDVGNATKRITTLFTEYLKGMEAMQEEKPVGEELWWKKDPSKFIRNSLRHEIISELERNTNGK